MKYLALLACLMAGCGTTDEAQIRALEARLDQSMKARDVDAALRCYASDAVLLMPGRPAIHGREAIGAALRAAAVDPRTRTEVRIERIEVARSAGLAFGYGSGLTTVEVTGAAPSRSASKWLAVFRKRDGAWEIAADAFNLD